MKTHRVWVEIVIVGTMIACALAVLIATLGAAAGAAAGPTEPQQSQTTQPQPIQAPATPAVAEQYYEGMLTCSRCGARHSAALGRTAADCVRICVHGGATFSLIDGDKIYVLDGDLNALKKVAGQRVHIVGAISDKTIRVSSVKAA